jgi:hypothetical protein
LWLIVPWYAGESVPRVVLGSVLPLRNSGPLLCALLDALSIADVFFTAFVDIPFADIPFIEERSLAVDA